MRSLLNQSIWDFVAYGASGSQWTPPRLALVAGSVQVVRGVRFLSGDLQLTLGRFAAEREADRMRIGTSESEAVALS